MEFDFNVDGVLPGIITVIESKDSNSVLRIYDLKTGFDTNQEANDSWTYSQSCNTPWDLRVKKRKEDLETIVDSMGLASARAQSLHSAITTLKKLLNSSQQKVYLMKDTSKPRSVIGMLKVGIKRLFVRDESGAHHEVDPLCVLDIYVHESAQRCGFGHELFNSMLKAENLKPEKLAVDRPSFKCLAFLGKHYNLTNPSPQNNNFVIYPGFLENRPILPNAHSIKLRAFSNNHSGDYMKNFHSTLPPHNTKGVKGKTYYASTGNLLHWNDTEKPEYDYHKNIEDPNIFPSSLSTNTYLNKEKKDWGVNEAMHSYTNYSISSKEFGGWNRNSNSRKLMSVDNVGNCNRRKLDSLQSSWNVLGVAPTDYSSLHKNTVKQ